MKVLVLLFCLLVGFCVAQDTTTCREEDPANPGDWYDLSALIIPAGGVDYKIPSQITTNTIVINVCRQINTVNSFCQTTDGMCEISSGFSSLGSIGATTTTFTVQSEGVLMMTYPGHGCNGHITFTCDRDIDIGTPTLTSVTGTCEYNLSWSTKHACPVANGLSIGSVLCIIFFVSLFLYIAIGMLVKRKRYDAQGVDMVPNIDFWRDLPALIKDGFRFAYGKCFNRS